MEKEWEEEGSLNCILYQHFWCNVFYSEELGTNYSSITTETEYQKLRGGNIFVNAFNIFYIFWVVIGRSCYTLFCYAY